MDKKALIVVTSHDTGWNLTEVSHVFWPLTNDGFEIDFASPKGGEAPIDMESCKLDDPENKSFVERKNIRNGISTLSMKEVVSSKYNVIYFAGGHGTMWDFPDNEDIQRVTSEIYERGGIVSAVCHGPAALTNVKLSDGKYLVEGREVSSFTDAEEREVEKDKIVPFLLESRLRERGAIFKRGNNWSVQVVTSDRLVTGQNPQSASALGKAIISTFDQIDKTQTPRDEDQRGAEVSPTAY